MFTLGQQVQVDPHPFIHADGTGHVPTTYANTTAYVVGVPSEFLEAGVYSIERRSAGGRRSHAAVLVHEQYLRAVPDPATDQPVSESRNLVIGSRVELRAGPHRAGRDGPQGWVMSSVDTQRWRVRWEGSTPMITSVGRDDLTVLDDPPNGPPPLRVGQWVRVLSPASSQPDSWNVREGLDRIGDQDGAGYVRDDFFGAVVLVEAVLGDGTYSVAADGITQVIHGDYLVPTDAPLDDDDDSDSDDEDDSDEDEDSGDDEMFPVGTRVRIQPGANRMGVPLSDAFLNVPAVISGGFDPGDGCYYVRLLVDGAAIGHATWVDREHLRREEDAPATPAADEPFTPGVNRVARPPRGVLRHENTDYVPVVKVIEAAMEAAQQHNLCDQVERTLRRIGLGDYLDTWEQVVEVEMEGRTFRVPVRTPRQANDAAYMQTALRAAWQAASPETRLSWWVRPETPPEPDVSSYYLPPVTIRSAAPTSR